MKNIKVGDCYFDNTRIVKVLYKLDFNLDKNYYEIQRF